MARDGDGLLFVLAEELFPILNEADENHHGRPRKAGKEHHFKQPHGKDGESHEHDCSLFSGLWSSVCTWPSPLFSAGGRPMR